LRGNVWLHARLAKNRNSRHDRRCDIAANEPRVSQPLDIPRSRVRSVSRHEFAARGCSLLSLNSPIFVLALARLLTNLAEPNSCSAEAKAKNPKNKVLANNSAQCPLWVEPDDRSFDSWRLFWRSRRRAQSAQRQIQRRQSGRSVANRRRRSDSEARMVRPKRPASFSSRAAKFTAGPMQVKSSRLPLPILPNSTSPNMQRQTKAQTAAIAVARRQPSSFRSLAIYPSHERGTKVQGQLLP